VTGTGLRRTGMSKVPRGGDSRLRRRGIEMGFGRPYPFSIVCIVFYAFSSSSSSSFMGRAAYPARLLTLVRRDRKDGDTALL